jgi:hypothetical protein
MTIAKVSIPFLVLKEYESMSQMITSLQAVPTLPGILTTFTALLTF